MNRFGLIAIPTLIVALLLAVVGIAFFGPVNDTVASSIESFSFTEDSAADWDDGTFVNTTVTDSKLALVGTNTTGTYTSDTRSDTDTVDCDTVDVTAEIATVAGPGTQQINTTVTFDGSSQDFQLSDGANALDCSGLSGEDISYAHSFENTNTTIDAVNVTSVTLNGDRSGSLASIGTLIPLIVLVGLFVGIAIILGVA